MGEKAGTQIEDLMNENFKLNKKMIEEKINSNISKKYMISVPLYHISENIIRRK